MLRLPTPQRFLRTLTALLIAVVSVGVGGTLAPHTAAAQATPPTQSNTPPVSNNPQANASGAAAKTAGDNMPEFGCFNSGSFTDTTFKGCYGYVLYRFMIFCMWVSGIAGYVLNYVVMELVVSMGVVVGNLIGITTTWMLLRDIANVFLVFLTIFVGISIIVGSSKFGSKQMLGKVLFAALLVNFSITVTKVIIDISNLATVQIYAMLLQQSSSNGGVGCDKPIEGKLDANAKECLANGIAGAFFNISKVVTVFKTDYKKNENVEQRAFAIGNVSIVAAIFFLVLTFVFGAGAFILMSRFLVLIMLIVLSPVAFVSYLTEVFDWGRKWWSTLMAQSFVAPVLMLMWYVVYKIAESMMALFGGGEKNVLSNVADVGDPNSTMIVFYLVLMTGFLILSLSVAREVGGSMSASAMGMWKKGVNKTARWTGRKTGRVAKWTGSKVGHGAAASGRWFRDRTYGWAADRLSKANMNAAARHFARDPNTNEYSGGTRAAFGRFIERSAVGRAVQRGVESQAKGYRDRMKRGTEANRGRTQELETTLSRQQQLAAAEALFEGGTLDQTANRRTVQGMSQEDLKWLRDNRPGFFREGRFVEALSSSQLSGMRGSKEYTGAEKAALTNLAYGDVMRMITRSGERDANGNIQLSPDEIRRLEKMTQAEMTILHDRIVANPEVTRYFSTETFEQVLKNEAYNDPEREALIRGRYADIYRALDSNSGDNVIRDAIRRYGDHEADLFGTGILNETRAVRNMSQATVDKILESKRVSATQKDGVRQLREEYLNDLVRATNNGTPPPIPGRTLRDELDSMRPAQKAKLSGNFIRDNDMVIDNFSAADIAEVRKVHNNDVVQRVKGRVVEQYNNQQRMVEFRSRVQNERSAILAAGGRPAGSQLSESEEQRAFEVAYRSSDTSSEDRRLIDAYRSVTNPIAANLF